MNKANFAVQLLKFSVVTLLVMAMPAFAAGRVTVGPYASVSSTKGIKPNKMKSASDETVTQRTTYGLRVGVRLGKFFSLGVDAGTNNVDTSKKAAKLRDEYGDIDFQKDLNVDPAAGFDYRYQEEQRLAKVQLVIQPIVTRVLTVKAAAGVRARQRIIKVTDKSEAPASKSVTDGPRYQPTAMAGVNVRLFRAFSANIQYDFYFMKFPKTEPHEQEVSVGFGAQL